jgi:RNA polymerase sigma-32 factor
MRRDSAHEPWNPPASLRLMLREVRRHPVVSAAEETELWRRYRVEHDERAGEELVLANLRFVVMVARQYRCRGVPMSDLVQEGNVGLLRAVQRFRPEMGFRLTSYAIWWIRAQIRNYILGTYSLVKLGSGRAQRKVFFCLGKARRELEASRAACTGCEDALVDDLGELAKRLGLSVEELEDGMRRIEARDVSIDSGGPGAAESAEAAWGPGLGGPDALDDEDRVAALRVALGLLCPRDRLIVEARFMANPPVKLRALAAQLGVTAARVHQLEARAVQRLRRALNARPVPGRALLPHGDPPRDADAGAAEEHAGMGTVGARVLH